MAKTVYLSDLKELAGKQFETMEALEKEEAKISTAIAEKQKKAESKKADAEKVKKAITARFEAEKAQSKLDAEAYRIYLNTCEKNAANVSAKKQEEKEALKEFCEKHPEERGFHETITIGDISYRYDYNTSSTKRPMSVWDYLLNW